ncbi:MAG TPA: ParA family protein [Deltaproteobacteria bacterium]|nr:ParA family protein [Deltaproteobacteria bacterium]
MARVVAISNQKGGVGKTTTAVNLSAALASLGRRVLVVDVDPQGNASSGLGYPLSSITMGVYDVIMGYRDFQSVLTPTENDKLHLLPASRDLIGAEIELIDAENRERRLRSVLAPLSDTYDDVLIDCPPSLGLLTINALTAADAVLIPLQAEYFAMEGLGELLRTIGAVRKSLNPELQREGILITMSDQRNNLCREVEEQARKLFGNGVFATVVPRNVRLSEAPSFGKPIIQYDRRSAGARAYLELASEIVKRRSASGMREAV